MANTPVGIAGLSNVLNNDLLSLGTINKKLGSVTQQLTTGLRVSQPQDNIASFFAAQGLRALSSSFKALFDGINLAVGALNGGVSALRFVSNLLHTSVAIGHVAVRSAHVGP